MNRSTAPRVRVVVLNYEGGDLTISCLLSVLATEWPADALDIVLVDNNSHDGVADRVETEFSTVTVIRNSTNLGFAGGNNVALRDLDGIEMVALVNNDAVVSPDWLAPLVPTMLSDASIGAVSPKILFFPRFAEVIVDTRGPIQIAGVRVDGLDVGARAHAVSGLGHPVHDPVTGTTRRSIEGTGVLRLPVGDIGPSKIEFQLEAERPTVIEVRSGGAACLSEVGEPAWHEVPVAAETFDVINNAGNELLDGQYGADRGYCERDAGQFDIPTDLFAWSGAAVLLRREYLLDTGLFDERLFLYYEDFELSWRGLDRGWRYRYEPRAVVRHIHAATTVERSAVSEYFNARNRLLVLTRHAPGRTVVRALRETILRRGRDRLSAVTTLLPELPPRGNRIRRRARALLGYVRLAPAMLRARQQDRAS